METYAELENFKHDHLEAERRSIMNLYFSGRRKTAEFTLPINKGSTILACQIFDYWTDIEETTTLWCGDKGKISIEKTYGLSERDVHTLNGAIESSIGPAGIFQLKGKAEETIQHEVNWQTATVVKKEFEFKAPDCGRGTRIVYQLMRDYELTFRRKNFLRRETTWERKFCEKVKSFVIVPDEDEYDERCKKKCKEPGKPSFVEFLTIIMGDVSMRVSFTRTDDGIEVNFDGVPLKIPQTSFQDFAVRLPLELVPAVVVFLGDLRGKYVNAIFSEWQQANIMYPEVAGVFAPETFYNARIAANAVVQVHETSRPLKLK
jgi:hypothetical protein